MILEGKDDDVVVDQPDDCVVGGVGKQFFFVPSILSKSKPSNDNYIWSNYSDLKRPHPKWWFSKGDHLISRKPRLVKYYNLARLHHLLCQIFAEAK